MDLSKEKPRRGDKLSVNLLDPHLHVLGAKGNNQEGLEVKLQEGKDDLVGIREPVGINQVTEMSILRNAICEERAKRWGKKDLRYRSKRAGLAVKYRWTRKEVARLKLYELR